jgi:trehalose/maltose hydrolase-like predicted phosphorylase
MSHKSVKKKWVGKKIKKSRRKAIVLEKNVLAQAIVIFSKKSTVFARVRCVCHGPKKNSGKQKTKKMFCREKKKKKKIRRQKTVAKRKKKKKKKKKKKSRRMLSPPASRGEEALAHHRTSLRGFQSHDCCLLSKYVATMDGLAML